MSLSYVSNSTTLNGVPVPDDTSGTAFPLDSPGYTIPIILSEGTSIFQYEATVTGSGGVSNIGWHFRRLDYRYEFYSPRLRRARRRPCS